MVEGSRPVVRPQGSHPQAAAELVQLRDRALVGSGDAGGEALETQAVAAGERPERVQRPCARSLAPRSRERSQPEGAGEVRHQLPGPDLQLAADFGDGGVGDGEQYQIYVLERGRLQAAAPVPGGEHAHSGRGKGREQSLGDRAASQDCRGADHSRRNSTPAAPAEARRVSPGCTRPARISSASGDSTSRWMTWRMGRAPSATW
jgi:hypothetical protein